MPFDIVSGVQLPTRERARKYNLDELDIGEALIIPQGEKHTASAIYTSARALGIKVAIRVMPTDDPQGRWVAGDTLVKRVAPKAEAPKAEAAE